MLHSWQNVANIDDHKVGEVRSDGATILSVVGVAGGPGSIEWLLRDGHVKPFDASNIRVAPSWSDA